jgi:predicted RNA-binding protein with PIN domain
MYLIDGNNLIGHTKSMDYHDPQARQKLLDRIMPFLEEKRRKAIVFFDGPSQPLRKNRWAQIVFSGHRSTADDRIRHMVESSKAPKDFCVVSSDNPVYSYSKTCGAQAMKCHEFNRLLQAGAVRETQRENRDLQIDNLQHWLRYFGEEE